MCRGSGFRVLENSDLGATSESESEFFGFFFGTTWRCMSAKSEWDFGLLGEVALNLLVAVSGSKKNISSLKLLFEAAL